MSACDPQRKLRSLFDHLVNDAD